MGELFFADNPVLTIPARLAQRYHERTGHRPGRMLVQKLCYFAKAAGLPVPYSFEMYHYGPFSQELYFDVQDLTADDVLKDKSGDAAKSEYEPGSQMETMLERYAAEWEPYSADIDRIVHMFKKLSPTEMELVSTVHYMYRALRSRDNREPTDDEVIAAVAKAKNTEAVKFPLKLIGKALQALRRAGVLAWAPASS